MDDQTIEIIVENQKEWRKYIVKQMEEVNEKVDRIDKELSTFKMRVMGMASIFGASAGLGTDFLKSIFFN